jgi:hypothetical protein
MGKKRPADLLVHVLAEAGVRQIYPYENEAGGSRSRLAGDATVSESSADRAADANRPVCRASRASWAAKRRGD